MCRIVDVLGMPPLYMIEASESSIRNKVMHTVLCTYYSFASSNHCCSFSSLKRSTWLSLLRPAGLDTSAPFQMEPPRTCYAVLHLSV
jgi:hypothetical protein